MSANAGEASAADLASTEVSPPEPWAPVRRSLQQMRDVPWAALGALATGSGVALLTVYFHAMGFVPADIPAILGASVFVAMAALALFAWVLMSLAAPLWAHQAGQLAITQDMANGRVDIAGFWGLPSLQALGVGLFFLWLGGQSTLECLSSAGPLAGVGAVLAFSGALAWYWCESQVRVDRRTRLKRLLSAGGVCLVSVLPVSALLILFWPANGAGWGHVAVMAAAWVIMVGAAAAVRHVPAWASALCITAIFPALAISLPLFLGSPLNFPNKVAELVGLRTARAVELRVPATTCRLIKSAHDAHFSPQTLLCEEGEWHPVQAQVLVNLGPRWLIELPLASGRDQAAGTGLRVTVPAEGIQIVQRPASSPAASCTRRWRLTSPTNPSSPSPG